MNYDLIGAFDRHNYGDILFPWVHFAFLKENGVSDHQVGLYSFSKADLRSVGGFETKPFTCLPEAKGGQSRRRIIVGGEVLAVDWVAMASNSLPRFFKYPLIGSRRVLGRSVANRLVAKIFGGKRMLPYVFQHDESHNAYYCSVGGTALAQRKYEATRKSVGQSLRSAGLVSVRDRETQAILAGEGVVSSLVPDVATLMSEFLTIEQLRSLDPLGYCERSSSFDPSGYFAVQVGRGHGAGSESEIAYQISELVRATNKSVLLVPIGRASGHEDHVILEDIFNRLNKTEPVAILRSENIFHIMGAIALSDGYTGTSLHGAITAFSFLKPVCGLKGSRVKKLAAYVETWFPEGSSKVVPGFEIAAGLGHVFRSHDKQVVAAAHSDQCLAVRSFLTQVVGGRASE